MLTPEERQWLAKHPVIIVRNERKGELSPERMRGMKIAVVAGYAVQAYGEREIRQQAEVLAPLACLDKPLDLALLLELLEQVDAQTANSLDPPQ